jgi:N-methylhydantoinase B
MREAFDPVSLEILRNQLEGVAEEMGELLIRSAYSPNIKERRDCSTALFDADGRLVAQAEHIPVHLGAMPEAVEAVLDRDPAPGDVFVLNDPYAGGTHLPDVTMVSPITVEGSIIAYGVSRAHHADIGGMSPGSMPAGATEIVQEGLRIPPTRLVDGGDPREEVRALLLSNVRNPDERRADLRAQRAANDRAAERVADLASEYGVDRLWDGFAAVQEYSRRRMAEEIESLPDGTYHATDVLEGDGQTDEEILIEAAVTVDGKSLSVDFRGTDPQVGGNVNAPLAVAKSAVYFVVRCLTDPEIPANGGCYDPLSISVPEGTLLNPTPPAAVVGGNVETSQRVTDVVFAAFTDAVPDRVPAHGQGTMNNLVVGSDEFTYYETIGGGGGALPAADGIDGRQVGMTNTLNTPVESIETEYPLRVERYGLRPDSGGEGQYRGGWGVERSIRLLTDATVSLLTERRSVAPAGVAGGKLGATGENLIDGEPVPAKITRSIPAGTTVTIRTPGGGGYGAPDDRSNDSRRGAGDEQRESEN